ncbi:hypothetical protein Tco_0669012 [Tanacetum coccineum]
MLIFKVDFEKAFDSVSWKYLDFVLHSLDFGLHFALSTEVSSNLIHGINLGSLDLKLSHLFYVNDVIITTEWNPSDLDNIIRVLHVFYLPSGLKININKSNIYGIRVSDDEVSNMACNSGCVVLFSFYLSWASYRVYYELYFQLEDFN